MIEQLVTSKTRIKILKLFLYDIDKRYYLRELERMLGESLSPLRRQLLKLVQMGILKIEDEANLKFYRLNRDFPKLEELRSMVLEEPVVSIPKEIKPEIKPEPERPIEQAGVVQAVRKQFRYDLLALTAVSVFIVITAIFIIYTSNRNFNQVADLISDREGQVAVTRNAAVSRSGPDTMKSGKWKISPGASSIFSENEL